MVDNKLDANDRAFAERMNDEAKAWVAPLAADALSADATVAEIIAANKAARAAHDAQHEV